MSDELKITKEKVIEAANSCPTAKAVLEKMFPEVFSSPMPLTGEVHKTKHGPAVFVDGQDFPAWIYMDGGWDKHFDVPSQGKLADNIEKYHNL